VKPENLVMNPGSAAVGYGFEYALTTLDRIKLAALEQNDTTLQVPIVMPVSFETWKVKESTASAADEPEWGDSEDRGVAMEISTAAGLLASGANAVILRHPRAVEVIQQFINELSE
jgi:acetyl-CoA decarbonylase/synthase complex subunit delta